VKTGDLVRLVGSHDSFATGVLIRMGPTGWWDILMPEGIVQWPTSQLEVINESR